ncbi:MAG: RNA 2',3'-cyclic phosphodiesterase [Deltaproteobacteria bacterium]|nr:RNA 2',3'-cyclic phosphodiesterase [Deltaproteobacteria bacterium]
MRLFLAVDLPLPMLQQVADGVEKLKKSVGRGLRFRWLAAQNIHITLKFLGEVEKSQLDQLSGCCAAIEWSGFVLKLGGSGYFPSVNRPRVFWQGFSAGIDEMRGLLAQVERCAAVIGVLKDPRPYTPHLTLARIKPSKDGNTIAAFRQVQKKADDLLPVGSFLPVTTFSLYQSQLTPAGAVYTRLDTFSARII